MRLIIKGFETKAIAINSMTGAVELLKKGYKVTIPMDVLNLPKEQPQSTVEQQQSNIEPLQLETNESQTKPINIEKFKPYFQTNFKGAGNNQINYFECLS